MKQCFSKFGQQTVTSETAKTNEMSQSLFPRENFHIAMRGGGTKTNVSSFPN